ncbi:hypothetical protein DL93DRAFT_2234241 [Clavulina sp. PMI_390]|nr:hypothetical protein DL93DRAFT_2234241 [Clavulina sp. PMI_390]
MSTSMTFKATTSSAAFKTTSSTASAEITSTESAAQYELCGGIGYIGSIICTSPYECRDSNAYYSRCLRA